MKTVLPEDVEKRFDEQFCFDDIDTPDLTPIKSLYTNRNQTKKIKQFIAQELASTREQAENEEVGYGYFEVMQDEETGRKYWYGAEDGWKDPEEIGENGVITMDAKAFEVGTVLTVREPIESLTPRKE